MGAIHTTVRNIDVFEACSGSNISCERHLFSNCLPATFSECYTFTQAPWLTRYVEALMKENIMSACFAVAVSIRSPVDNWFLSLLISKGCFSTNELIPQTTPTVHFSNLRPKDNVSALFNYSICISNWKVIYFCWNKPARKHGNRKQISVL